MAKVEGDKGKKGHLQYYLAAAAALVTIIVYLPALRNEFVNWDDDIYVYDNPEIRSLNAAFFRWAFFGFHASNWHPLTWISHAADFALWGLNPLGHHLTNIILHAVNTLLVVLLMGKLFKIAGSISSSASVLFLNDRTVLTAAAVTGLLFGIHPLHVESVAWIADRKDLLCGLFFLLSVMIYIRYAGGVDGTAHRAEGTGQGVESGETQASVGLAHFDRRYLAALVLFALALLSKAMAVSLPVVLLILDWYPFGRVRSLKTFRNALAEKIPFFMLGLVSSVLTILAQKQEGAMAAMEVVPLSARVMVAAHALIAYLWKMLLPVNQLPFYPYPRMNSMFSLEYLSALVLLIGITTACVVLARRQRVWLAVWIYYIALLIPVCGIVQIGGQEMADRYTYLPSLGPFLLIGITAAAVSEKGIQARQRGRVAFSAVAVVTLVALSSLTVRQIRVWRTSMDLWNHAIKTERTRAPLVYYNRGQVFMNKGQFDRAIEDYSTAITLNPFYDKAIYNRGLALEKSGQPGRAADDYERAIFLNPSNYRAFNNRGILYGVSGSYRNAIEFFSRALAVKPDYSDAYLNRGITYSIAGASDNALADFNKAIELDQRSASAYLNRAQLLLRMDLKGPAAADFRKACELGINQACSHLP